MKLENDGWYKEQAVIWAQMEDAGWIFSAPPKIPGWVGLLAYNPYLELLPFTVYVPLGHTPQEIHTALLELCEKHIDRVTPLPRVIQ